MGTQDISWANTSLDAFKGDLRDSAGATTGRPEEHDKLEGW